MCVHVEHPCMHTPPPILHRESVLVTREYTLQLGFALVLELKKVIYIIEQLIIIVVSYHQKLLQSFQVLQIHHQLYHTQQ